MFTNKINNNHTILFIINEEPHQPKRIWKAGRRTRMEVVEAEPEDEAGATWSGLQATGSLQ